MPSPVPARVTLNTQDFVRVRELNDKFRGTVEGGEVYDSWSRGASGYLSGLLERVCVGGLDSFAPDDDRYVERNLGALANAYFCKIDCNEAWLRFHWRIRPTARRHGAKTRRVLQS